MITDLLSGVEELDVNDVTWHSNQCSKILLGEEGDVFTNYLSFEPSMEIASGTNFADPVWDFSDRDKLHKKPYCYIFEFNEIRDTAYRILLKRKVLRELFINRNRFTSVQIYYIDSKHFIKYLESRFIINPLLITNKVINQFMKDNNPHITEKTKQRTLGSIKKFLKEIEYEIPEFHLSELDESLNNIDNKLIKLQNAANKTPNIPQKLFDQIVKVALEDMRNQELPLKDRMIACMILILSQVGMRRSEFILLEVDKLKTLTISEGKQPAYYMEFLTFKTAPTIDGKITETWMNEIGLEAYRTLVEIGKDRRKKKGGSLALYPNPDGKIVSPTTITEHITRFFYRNQGKLINTFSMLKEIEKEQLEVQEIKVRHLKHGLGLTDSDIGRKIYKVNPHQFRVAVANSLKSQGMNLEWIKRHMNHMEEEMTKHYFRDDEKIIKETLFKRANKDGSQLEINPEHQTNEEIRKELDDPFFVEAYKAINKFLKKKKYNIFANLNEILSLLKDNPIRETELGYCMKAIGQLCERQERLSTFEKWYYVRPQIVDIADFHLTYERFKDKLKLVKHNKKVSAKNSKFQRHYELELKSLGKFFSNKFLPEFKALKNEIEDLGELSLISSYPNLEGITSNIQEIERAIKEWQMMMKS